MDEYKFNVADVPNAGMGDFELLPSGDYVAQAISVEQVNTKSGNGDWYYEFTFEVVDGEKRGRLLFTKFNLVNKTPKAVQISREGYAVFHTAAGKEGSSYPTELLNIPMSIKVSIEKGTGGFADKNQIKGFKSLNGQQPQTVGQDRDQFTDPAQTQMNTPEANPVPATTSAPDAGSKKPWE